MEKGDDCAGFVACLRAEAAKRVEALVDVQAVLNKAAGKGAVEAAAAGRLEKSVLSKYARRLSMPGRLMACIQAVLNCSFAAMISISVIISF